VFFHFWTKYGQALFYVQVIPYGSGHEPNNSSWGTTTESLAYAPLPVLLSLLIECLMIFILLGLSFLTVKLNQPLDGSCILQSEQR